MKGIVFNLLEEAVVSAFGTDTWDDLLDAANLSGAYTSLGSYPDTEIVSLVEAAAAATGKAPAEILRWFGRSAMPLLAERYGDFFKGHSGARPFILSVNDIIHPEVRKLYSGAGCPHFQFSSTPSGDLSIGYQSPRQLCHLAHGFVEGAADHFEEAVELQHTACMLDGSPICRMTVHWLN